MTNRSIYKNKWIIKLLSFTVDEAEAENVRQAEDEVA